MVKKPIRVLYINGGTMHRGGIESYMMNYYRHMSSDEIQIDFVVHGYEKGVYDDEILSLGGHIYHVPVKTHHPVGNALQLYKIMSKKEYTIVHSHMDAMSIFPLWIAKCCGISIRIAHSHNTQHLTNNKIKRIFNEVARKKLPMMATDLFACSKAAGEWLFKYRSTLNFEVIPNAIDIKKYLFSKKKRKEIRALLNISEDAQIVGHVGRFDYQKNQSYLVDIFDEMRKLSVNCHLIMIGSGEDKNMIQSKVQTMHLEKVYFVDACDNVNEYYNVFDVFVFPSHFEGLGIVLIEASVNGLSCLVSEAVTKETNIAKNITYFSLKQSKKQWASEAIKLLKSGRVDCEQQIRQAGYDIRIAAIKLQDKYLELGQRNER